jgi:23S rRNA pseudouridine1911/1915/1917 synthase
MNIEILYLDKNIVVAYKEPKIPVVKDKTLDLDLKTMLESQLKLKIPLHVINRIDRPVGGLVLFALTKEAAGKISKRLTTDSFKKYYRAITTGVFQQNEGKITDYLTKTNNNYSKVTNEEDKEGKRAVLKYEVIASLESLNLVQIELLTGRHHQIRVQMANNNTGLWGDTKYNPDFLNVKGWHQIALQAYRLHFKHPITDKWIDVSVPMPKEHPWELFGGI